jgi:hypothetical protein
MLLAIVLVSLLNLIYTFINAEIPKLSIEDQLNSNCWIWEEGFYN